MCWRVFNTILLWIISAVALHGQQITIKAFEVFQAGRQVRLSWVLRSGFTCNGIQIERARGQSGNFLQVGDIQGVCGSPAEDVDYRFTDQPLPGYGLYRYRLKLGLEGFSNEKRLYFLGFDDRCHSVFPQPAGPGSKLVFCNDARGPGVITLYSITGRLIKRRSWNAARRQLDALIDKLPAAAYFFRWQGNVIITGKLIIR